MIKIVIVHFNTPELTECLVKSINKFVPESVIYIFDNSDKNPFTYRQDNIVYIDNTDGSIIDFNSWLKKFPKRNSVCYSPKHAYTIEKIIETLNEPFILLDSDVLLKRDISDLYDEKLAFIGEERNIGPSPRIFPFLCFINPKILREKGVKYFNENDIISLNSSSGKKYDTGYSLYANKNILPHKLIKYSEYIVHYGGGSYEKNVFKVLHKNQVDKETWLNEYKNLWE